jgi:hypothetical protein
MLGALLQAHGDDPTLDLVYFWAAVLIALTPVLIFGGLGVWIARKIWRERREANAEETECGMRNSKCGIERTTVEAATQHHGPN